jgi:hypothetical protein
MAGTTLGNSVGFEGAIKLLLSAAAPEKEKDEEEGQNRCPCCSCTSNYTSIAAACMTRYYGRNYDGCRKTREGSDIAICFSCSGRTLRRVVADVNLTAYIIIDVNMLVDVTVKG